MSALIPPKIKDCPDRFPNREKGRKVKPSTREIKIRILSSAELNLDSDLRLILKPCKVNKQMKNTKQGKICLVCMGERGEIGDGAIYFDSYLELVASLPITASPTNFASTSKRAIGSWFSTSVTSSKIGWLLTLHSAPRIFSGFIFDASISSSFQNMQFLHS